MRKRIRRGLDVLGLLIAVAGVLAVIAIAGHDSADPPVAKTHPSNPAAVNPFGTPGAVFTDTIIRLFRWSAVPLFIGWFVLALTVFFDARRGVWGWRLLGWLLLVPTFALGGEWLGRICTGNPHREWGGVIGTSLYEVITSEVNAVGLCLILGAGTIAGFSLAFDSLCGWVFRRLHMAWQRRREAAALRRAERLKSRIETNKEPKPVPSTAARSDRTAPPLARSPKAMLASHEPTALPPIVRKEPMDPPPVSHPAPMPAQIPPNNYQLPPFDLLEDPVPFPYDLHDQQLRERAVKLEKIFADFDINIRVVGINTGPVITQYEIALETGLRLHKVTRLADDLALNLKVPAVRIVAPIPNKDTVGVEIPNEHRAVVRLKEVILNAGDALTKNKIPLFLGKDTEGRPLVYDLADMPHLLIAGRTGTGKSVCMNAIILSMLMTRRPDEVQMIMIDPKMLELSEYGKIPHLMHPVVKDMRKAEAILSWAVDKMEERYDLLSRARVRGIAGYNELSPEEIFRRVKPADDEEAARIPQRMPYIVIFVDEMNDLMMTMRKEVEGHIIRLAQKSRAAGIHLVVATQKPTVDVITGLIKSNLPARICFQVSSRSDSRVVLDEMGAEKLLGKGDMLFLQPGTSTIVRAQGTYASDNDITKVVEYLECEPTYSRELIQLSTKKDREAGPDGVRNRDDMYDPAIEVVVREGRGSVSLLQRALGIGYGRAARLIDFMAEDGIVGGYNGSNAREVLISMDQWEDLKARREPDAA